MANYQIASKGSSPPGAARGGQVATVGNVHLSLGLAALSGVLAMLLVQRLVADRSIEEGLSPSRAFKAPVLDIPPESGHVVVTIEYFIDPARAAEFRALM